MSNPSAGSTEGVPTAWEVLQVDPVADCRVFTAERLACRHPLRGRQRTFFRIRSSDWVNVAALTPGGDLVLVNQWRFGIGSLSLELPGGMIDPGEDPVAAGLRELQEETGYRGDHAVLLGSSHPNPAIQTNRCHFVLVEGCVRVADLAWDPDEEIAISVEPLAAVLAGARAGRLSHALTWNALFLLEGHLAARAASDAAGGPDPLDQLGS